MRFFKRALLVLLFVFLAWIGLLWSQWLPPTSDVQRKAVAVMEAPPITAKGQHNAFPLLWLAAYDIPAGDVDRVMAADVARFAAAGSLEDQMDFKSSAKGTYRAQAWPAGTAPLCTLRADCLAETRGRMDAARKLLVDHALLLGHARELAAADHVHDPFPPGVSSPVPQFGQLPRLQLTDAAFQFANGHPNEALDEACTTAATWRRLATHSDSMLLQMVGSGVYESAARLSASMLAEMPVDAPLPDSCTTAFAPVTDVESSLCDAVKTEWRMFDGIVGSLTAGSKMKTLVARLEVNRRATSALWAVQLAPYCTSDPGIAAEKARMARADRWSVDGWLGATFNPEGSVMVAVMSDHAYDSYVGRMHDMQMLSRLMAGLLALRAQPGGTTDPVALQKLAGSMPKGYLDSARAALWVTRSRHHQGEPSQIAIPIPGSRMPGSAPASPQKTTP